MESIQILSERISYKTKNGMKFKKLNEIVTFEAESNYTRITFVGKKEQVIICKTLKELEEMLPKRHFVRIHRSWIINLNAIKEYVSCKNQILLLDDIIIPLARNRKKVFLSAIQMSLKYHLS